MGKKFIFNKKLIIKSKKFLYFNLSLKLMPINIIQDGKEKSYSDFQKQEKSIVTKGEFTFQIPDDGEITIEWNIDLVKQDAMIKLIHEDQSVEININKQQACGDLDLDTKNLLIDLQVCAEFKNEGHGRLVLNGTVKVKSVGLELKFDDITLIDW